MAAASTTADGCALRDILTDEQLQQVIAKCVPKGTSDWRLVTGEVKYASENLKGLLGNHLRVTLNLEVRNEPKTVHVFVKSMPMENEGFVKFLKDLQIYKREMVALKLLDEAGAHRGTNPCCPKVLLYSETVLVMSDLAVEGYIQRSPVEAFDLEHILVMFASLARYHAVIANYETKKSISQHQPYNLLQEYGDVIVEITFCDSAWLRSAASNVYKFVVEYFPSYKEKPDLEEKLTNFIIEACATLQHYEDTMNVLIHKDMWVNNIMFKYENGVPINAVLVDYQVVRYGPPSFDVMAALYLNSSRELRDQHEPQILRHYYDVFTERLDDETRARVEGLKYDFSELTSWCGRSRKFGVVLALCELPYTMMVAGAPVPAARPDRAAQLAYISDDRSDRKLRYGRECPEYRDRIVDLCAEFIDRYASQFQ